MDEFSSLYMDFSSSTNTFGIGLNDPLSHQTVDFSSSSFLQDNNVKNNETEKSFVKTEPTNNPLQFDSFNDFSKSPFSDDSLLTSSVDTYNSSNSTLENLLEGSSMSHQILPNSTNDLHNPLTIIPDQGIKTDTDTTATNLSQTKLNNEIHTSQSQNIYSTIQSNSKHLCKVQIVKKVNGTNLGNLQPLRILKQHQNTASLPLINVPVLKPPETTQAQVLPVESDASSTEETIPKHIEVSVWAAAKSDLRAKNDFK